MTESRIYLDNNATTRVLPEVAEVMADAWNTAFANPGSQHSFGRDARTVLEDSRDTIAGVLGADSSEVIFTSGGTESINAAVRGFTLGRTGTIALTRGEHPATVKAYQRAAEQGLQQIYLEVDSQGLLLADQIDALPWDTLKLITVILAHNETGVIQNLEPWAHRCRQEGVPLLVDAVQAVGKVKVDFRQLGAAALAFGAHKFHGPRGIGGLLLQRGVQLPPLLEGGHQESGHRAGTEPVPLIAGMSKALEIFDNTLSDRTATVRALRDQLQSAVLDTCDPALVHAADAPRLPNTLSIAFPGVDGEAMLVNLDLEGIACSLGSTCASGSAEPAPALLAMGCAADICTSSVRFSLSHLNTAEEIQDAAQRISRVINRLRRFSPVA